MDPVKIDVKGLDCPIPLIELKKALASAEKGQLIELEFTCPEATVNIPDYCERNGVEIVDCDREGNRFWRIVVRA